MPSLIMGVTEVFSVFNYKKSMQDLDVLFLLSEESQ